ncbi:4116_t:CDS:10, partial [Ambispora gerdemannii]
IIEPKVAHSAVVKLKSAPAHSESTPYSAVVKLNSTEGNKTATTEHVDLNENPIIYKVRLQSDNNRTRILYLVYEDNLNLLKKMIKWRKDNDSKSMEDAIDEFGDSESMADAIDKFGEKNDRRNVCDALARIIYDQKFPDFIFKFDSEHESTDDIDTDHVDTKSSRRKFELLLLLSDLFVEHEIDSTKNVTYVKIWTPFMALCEAAEEVRIKKELDLRIDHSEITESQENSNGTNKKPRFFNKIYQFLYRKISPYFVYKVNLEKKLSFFQMDQLKKYKGAYGYKRYSDIALHFWSSSNRSLLTYHRIIDANQLKPKLDNQIVEQTVRLRSLGFKQLIEKRVYTAFYPLHDGEIDDREFRNPEKSYNKKLENLRSILYESWIKSRKRQPLSEIREYLGEKLAIYFAWLGLYASWLFVASIFGIITIIYGIIDYATIDNDNNVTIVRIWDNAFTIVFALFMSIWATCFLESWKRYNAALAHDWGVSHFKETEQSRPGFHGTETRQSQVTNKQEIIFPLNKRLQRYFLSITLTITSMLIVIATIGSLLLFSKKWFYYGPIWSSVISSTINLGVVHTLSLFYKTLARKLTELENLKTETSFEDSHILKVYLFDFINFYAALFYILMLKDLGPKIFPGERGFEGCEGGNCMTELTIQLAIILIGKQAIGQLQELGLPLLKKKLDAFKNKFIAFILCKNKTSKKEPDEEIEVDKELASIKVLKESTLYPWIIDDDLLPTENDDLREEYEEMTVQFGFIALFATAFPLAPLCAWFNNYLEIRTDGYKYIKQKRRPISSFTQTIGMWDNIIYVISILAVLTNAAILAFHSSYMKKKFEEIVGEDGSLLSARLVFILAFENFVLFVKFLVAYFIPDVPNSLKVAIKRHEYLERVAIAKKDLASDEYFEDKEHKRSANLTELLKIATNCINDYK